MKVLVTGGTGFVGTHLVNALHRRGHAVAVLARDPASIRNRYNRAVEAVPGNVLDPACLAAACAGREAVIHLVGIINEKGPQTFD
ncbi:MAG: SDR family oxidoreductase, partial [Thermoanaerobaculia bacterium]